MSNSVFKSPNFNWQAILINKMILNYRLVKASEACNDVVRLVVNCDSVNYESSLFLDSPDYYGTMIKSILDKYPDLNIVYRRKLRLMMNYFNEASLMKAEPAKETESVNQ